MEEETTSVVAGANTTAEAVVASPVAQPAPSTKEKMLILVIEDDKFLRELIVRKLLKEGYAVQSAIDAQAAYLILVEQKPDIILCDLILPGIDGFEILKHLKEDPKTKEIPVVILSNLGQKEDFDKAAALGAKDFMVKANFTLDDIIAKIKSIIGA